MDLVLMPTGYEVDMYRDIHSIADSLRRIARCLEMEDAPTPKPFTYLDDDEYETQPPPRAIVDVELPEDHPVMNQSTGSRE